MADHSRDQAVTRIASTQRNLISTEQLWECGLGKDAVARRVRAGWLRLRFHGVYSVGSGELPPLALEFGALMSCGKGTLVSHRSAAFVWGMRENQPPNVEVSVVGPGSGSRKGMRVHRIQAIDKRELRRHEGLWVSSPARAVLEVAAVGSQDELIDVVDAGLALRRFKPRDLQDVLARHRGRRGAARLAELLGDETAMAISRSRAEKALLRLIRDARLPLPETNVKFGRFEADFLWRRERVIVELDSPTFHGGPGVFQRDREKDLVFRDAGFDPLRFTRAHVIHERRWCWSDWFARWCGERRPSVRRRTGRLPGARPRPVRPVPSRRGSRSEADQTVDSATGGAVVASCSARRLAAPTASVSVSRS